MRGLSAYAWRTLAARRLRSGLTVAGIAIGVAVLFAALATNAGIDSTIDRTVAASLGRADLRVAAFEQRGLSQATVTAIASTPGVALVSPAVERRTYLQLRPGILTLPLPVTVLGIDPATFGQLHDLPTSSGVGLSPGLERSAVIGADLAASDRLGLGDEVTLQGSAQSGPQGFKVVGIIAAASSAPNGPARQVIVSIDAARALFAIDGVTQADVRLAPGADVGAVSAALESRLTSEPYVLSTPADLAESLQTSTAGFEGLMALVAAVALFVGAFLIVNTLSMTVAEQMREIGLLRAAGTTSNQVVRLVLLQALILGVIGSILGVVIGFALAIAVAAAVSASGAVPIDAPVAAPVGTLLVLALGVLVTAISALEPAWRAGAISTVEALRAPVDPSVGRGARLRWLVAVIAVVAVAGLLVMPGALFRQSAGLAAVRPLAVYGLLLVATLLTPLVLPSIAGLIGGPLALIFRTEARLARSAFVRDRSRTALTVGALVVGLAMMVAMATVAQDARRAASDWLSGVIPGSEILTSIRPVGLDEPARSEIAAVPGVAGVSPMALFGVSYRGVRLDAAAVVGADLLAADRLVIPDADRTAALHGIDAGGWVIVPRSLADRFNLGVGGEMTFGTAVGPTRLSVIATAERTLPGESGEAILLGWLDAQNYFGVKGADLLAVRYAPGQESSARPTVDRLAIGEALQPSGLDAIQGTVSESLGRIFGLFDALAWIAVVVAGLGIVNTLTMSVVERIREIGMLRAAGMTRRQVSRMVLVEAALLGLAGAIVGCVAGLVVAASMLALGGAGAISIQVPWPAVGLAALFGVVVAILAAAYPARVAGSISIVRAVQYE